MRRWLVWLPLLLVAAGCGRPVQAPLVNRSIWVAAVEFKGGAEVAREPFPAGVTPPGPGIRLMAPAGERGRWETEVYRWDPGTIVIHQGERVTLHFWGVHGEVHPTLMEGYGLQFTVRRGRSTAVTLRADRPGIFRIVCQVHQPSMVAHLVVLPEP